LEKFSDIRPYLDKEVPEVMVRFAASPLLISFVRETTWPTCPGILAKPLDFFIKRFLKRRLKKIRTIDDFQQKIVADVLLRRVLSSSTNGLTSSGIEKLPQDKCYIFISNHRDIVLDSAFLNYQLHFHGHKVPFIAFGDNLLINNLVEDLIRINRAFIVKRDLPPRAQFKELVHLSEYINQLRLDGNHFWIAQKEGRAKDGIDSTNPAIIKMFYLSERKKQPDFSAFINSCNIVPVALSYEKDPCDRLKGWELYRKLKRGEHKKKRNEDFISMAAGILGDKGRVHISVGQPLNGQYNDDEEVAQAINQAIHQLYHLWPSNYIAYDEVYGTKKYSNRYSIEEKENFLMRYERVNRKIRPIILKIYSNPVLSAEKSSTD